MPYIPGIPGINDVYHSPNVFANNVQIALWLSPGDRARRRCYLHGRHSIRRRGGSGCDGPCRPRCPWSVFDVA